MVPKLGNPGVQHHQYQKEGGYLEEPITDSVFRLHRFKFARRPNDLIALIAEKIAADADYLLNALAGVQCSSGRWHCLLLIQYKFYTAGKRQTIARSGLSVTLLNDRASNARQPYNFDMEYFVEKKSIVRKIWGKSDTVLFIFAGASAEFALNKAVDWLYFTGKLPADPLGRLFSTVRYARMIVFAPKEQAIAAVQTLRQIHGAVEKSRGFSIPDWAYRDVLFMLIHYSIAAYELLEKPLTLVEKEEVFDVFYRVGTGMGLSELPATYSAWLMAREEHLQQNLAKSDYTIDLFKQYKKHLGAMRFRVLIEGQKLVVPTRVKSLLDFADFSLLAPVVPVYKVSRLMKMDWLLKSILLPSDYKEQINELDVKDE